MIIILIVVCWLNSTKNSDWQVVVSTSSERFHCTFVLNLSDQLQLSRSTSKSTLKAGLKHGARV